VQPDLLYDVLESGLSEPVQTSPLLTLSQTLACGSNVRYLTHLTTAA
jgi:hypothetical protein